MVVGDSPADWPPPGFKEDIKTTNGRKIKIYTHVETGKKFYSKKEVSRYMNSKDTCLGVTQVDYQDNKCSEVKVSEMNYQEKSFSDNNVSQVNDQDKSCFEDNISQMNNQDKSSSGNNVSQIVEGTKISHEWLPPGWIVELRTRKSGSNAGMTYKVYIDPSTGSKFYSKPEVSKYLKTMKQNNIAGEEQIHGTAEVSTSNQKASDNSKDIGGNSRISKRRKSDTDQSSNGIEEGSKQKTSQDSEENGERSCISKRKKSGANRPSTKTFPAHGAGDDFSNEKASQDSKENGPHSPLSKRKKPGTDSPSAKTVSSVAVDCDSVDELPPGWKKEVITRHNDRGIRKDSLYTDPVHGYVFRSKKDVFRYLETGDTSRCARRSAKSNVASTPTTDDASLKKSECSVTGKQLFATDEPKAGKSLVTCSPAQVEKSKKQPECSVADANTIITSILAEINENHFDENINEDAEIGLAGATESVGLKRLSPVSTPQSDLRPAKQLPENEQEKRSCKAATEQSSKSRNTKSLKAGVRVSKRLAGHSPEVEADLDLGERAIPAVVEKSASPSPPLDVGGQELLKQPVPKLETGDSAQASPSSAAPSDDLPPGWKKEIKITKKASGIRKDPLYIDPVHGYVFRSKKDVFRYLQTGDINSCATRPGKKDLDTTLKESSPTALNTSSKNSGCSVTERQPSASRGGKRSGTYSPVVQAKSSKKQPGSSASNPNTIITSSAADINAKHSYENGIENAEISLDTEPEIRDTNGDRKVTVSESVDVKRVSAVSARKSDVLTKEKLPENEQEKQTNEETVEQSKRSRKKKLLTPGHRTSKRLVGQNPEPVADLDIGERALRAVVKKSTSSGLPLKVNSQEIPAQNKYPTVGTGNSDQASLSRETSVAEIPPGREKEILAQTKDPTVGTGNSDQAYLSRDAPVDKISSLSRDPPVGKISPRRKKKTPAQNKDPAVPAQNKYPTVGTGNSDQASLSRGTSVAEIPPGREKEILALNKDPTVGTGNSDQASLSRDAPVDKVSSLSRDPPVGKISPRRKKKTPAQNKDPAVPAQNKYPTVGTGNSDLASLSRGTSVAEIPPGREKEILALNKDPTVGTGNSDQASLSRDAPVDKVSSLSRDPPVGKISPHRKKKTPAQNKDPAVGTGISDQASLSRVASEDELPPGWTKEILVRNGDPTVRTGNAGQASLSREFSDDELPPGWTREMLVQNRDPTVRTGNAEQASLSREFSDDELPPGWTREMLAHKKDPIVRTGNIEQVSLSREYSDDELPPGWTREMLAQKKDPIVRTGNIEQASLSREYSDDELPPGWTKEMLAQNKDSTRGIGNSHQASLSGEASVDELPPGWTKEMLAQNKAPTKGTGSSGQASVDELPPGWKKEIRIRKNSRRIKKDPFYTDPVHGYIFRSRRDVMRYLQTGDISSCAVRPTKRGTDSAVEDNSPSTHAASSEILGCSLTGRQLFAAKEKKGGKCSITYSMAPQAESSNEQPGSSGFNLNTSISSIAAEITETRSCENVNKDTEVRLDIEAEIRDLFGEPKTIASEYVDVKRSSAVFPQSDILPEQKLPETEKEKHSNKGALAQSRKFRNKNSLAPVRRVSKKFSHHNPDVAANLDLGEHALRAVVKKTAPSGFPLNVSGQGFPQQIDLVTGSFDPAYLSKKASSQDDPLEEFTKCSKESQAFKEQKAAMELTSEKQDNEKRILQDSWPAEILHGSRNVQLERQEVREWHAAELVKEEQGSQKRFLKDWEPAELAWESRRHPVEDQSASERSTAQQVHKKRGYENMQWQDPQLAQPSQRRGELNVENQSVRGKQTGELVTENQDDQSRRLQTQLSSHPFGDYWSDPCLEFAFKTLTGAIPVEDTLPFQGSTQQEFGSYPQVYDGCFDLPVFNNYSFDMNEVPNPCPSEEHASQEHLPINQTFLPTGNNSIPGCSSVSSQNPGLDTQAKDYQSNFKPRR